MVILVTLGAVVLAGCGTSTPTVSPQVPVVNVIPKDAAIAHPSPPPPQQGNCTASLPPPAVMPSPGQMPSGSYMAQIQARGYLKVGVAQSTYLWGYRDPVSGQLSPSGFDIDMLRQVAQAIFGSPNDIRYTIVPNKDRQQAVQSGEVDIVAETMTVTCAREKNVDFSTVYYQASQKILVPINSSIKGKKDLGGKRVCGPADSTSVQNLVAPGMPQHIQIWTVNDMTDCMVMLQQHQVDAISTDDAILVGLKAQDPNNTTILPEPLSSEPYGLAISKAHPDFTSFVNGVLAQVRLDGTWAHIYDAWLLPQVGGATPAPPSASYR
jgi:polar amino acid transport system substrate-binding protein